MREIELKTSFTFLNIECPRYFLKKLKKDKKSNFYIYAELGREAHQISVIENEDLKEYLKGKDYKIEYEIQFPLEYEFSDLDIKAKILMTGVIDILIENEEYFEIIEMKSTSKVRHSILQVYIYAYSFLDKVKEVRWRFYFIYDKKFGKEGKVSIADKNYIEKLLKLEIKKKLEWILNSDKYIKEGRIGSYCRYCEFLESCPLLDEEFKKIITSKEKLAQLYYLKKQEVNNLESYLKIHIQKKEDNVEINDIIIGYKEEEKLDIIDEVALMDYLEKKGKLKEYIKLDKKKLLMDYGLGRLNIPEEFLYRKKEKRFGIHKK